MNLCKQPREVSLGELDWCAVHKVISGSWRAEMCEPRSDPLHQFHSLHPYKLRLWGLIRRAILALPCAPQTGSVTNHQPPRCSDDLSFLQPSFPPTCAPRISSRPTDFP